MDENVKSIIDKAYIGCEFLEIKDEDNYRLYKLKNESGIGEMRCYDLCEGIQLSYNNLNMNSVFQEIKPSRDIIQIDHCLEGCYEFKLKDFKRSFIGNGDLSIIDLEKMKFESSCIPMNRYIGISLFINVPIANQTLKEIFPQGNIDLFMIRKKLCSEQPTLIIRSRHDINHIVDELYRVDERIRKPYSIIKVIELILFLSLLEKKDTERISSFSDPVYIATQECYKSLVENPFEKHFIGDLAIKYGISESSLKRCFTYITGNSIGNFIKNTKLKAAADLLVNKQRLSIGEISEIVGYQNQSKFSSAFKSFYGESPQEYRNKSR